MSFGFDRWLRTGIITFTKEIPQTFRDQIASMLAAGEPKLEHFKNQVSSILCVHEPPRPDPKSMEEFKGLVYRSLVAAPSSSSSSHDGTPELEPMKQKRRLQDVLKTPTQKVLFRTAEMTPPPVEPLKKRGLMAEKRQELEEKKKQQKRKNNKSEATKVKAKSNKSSSSKSKQKSKSRKPNNGPMQQAMAAFFQRLKAQGMSQKECQAQWKVSDERQEIINGLSGPERRRRRFV